MRLVRTWREISNDDSRKVINGGLSSVQYTKYELNSHYMIDLLISISFYKKKCVVGCSTKYDTYTIGYVCTYTHMYVHIPTVFKT